MKISLSDVLFPNMHSSREDNGWRHEKKIVAPGLIHCKKSTEFIMMMYELRYIGWIIRHCHRSIRGSFVCVDYSTFTMYVYGLLLCC